MIFTFVRSKSISLREGNSQRNMRKIFIGSSSGAKKKANYVRNILQELGVESVVCWFDSGVFAPGDSTLDILLKLTRECNGAVFIFDKDDELVNTPEMKRYVPRDNVVLEAGLFIGSLGKNAVVLCHVPGAYMLSDYSGVTHLSYDSDDPERMKEVFRDWLTRRVRGDRVSKSENNIFMESRKIIHRRYSLADEFHLDDEGFYHIHKIRIMNMAGNLVTGSEYTDPAHELPGMKLSQIIRLVLEKTTATLDLMLLDPNERNLRDAAVRIPNPNARSPEDLIYASWNTIRKKVNSDDVYRDACQSNRFRCFASIIGMPYAIFGVEYDGEYTQYNHVKIDLYSSGLGDESQRRSFVVWQDTSPQNYDFFIQNFDNIRGNPSVCHPIRYTQNGTLENIAPDGKAGRSAMDMSVASDDKKWQENCEKIIGELLGRYHSLYTCNRMEGFAKNYTNMLAYMVENPAGILNSAERVVVLEMIEPDSERLSVTVTKYFDYMQVDPPHDFYTAFFATEMQAKTYRKISLKIDGEDYTTRLHIDAAEAKLRDQLPYHVKSNRIPLQNPKCKIEYTAAYECAASEFFQSTKLSNVCRQFKADIFLGESVKREYELLCATFSPFSKIHYDDCKAGELSAPYTERILLPLWSPPGSGYVIALKRRSAGKCWRSQ